MIKKIFISFIITILFFFGLGMVVFLPFAAVTKGTVIATYATPKSALLVIDIQRDMTEKNGMRPLNLQQTDLMIPVVNRLIENADKNNWLVIYITHQYKKNSILRLVTRDFLLEGQPGAETDQRIFNVNQNHFVKYRMDAFTNKYFEEYLHKNQVNRLFLTGIAAEECLDKTCQAALNRGYEVTVVNDAIAGKTDSSRKRKIQDYQRYGARIVEARALIEQ